MTDDYLFSSESVAEGHPDKIADQISDAVVDAYLLQDPSARVACECLIKSGAVILAGEVRSDAQVDIETIVRQTIRHIGYDRSDKGFDGQTCAVISLLGHQSDHIATAIESKTPAMQGAGDQGIVVGYACNETPECMPAALMLAHQLMMRQAQVRRCGSLPFLLPDGKSQVTLRYRDHQAVSVDTLIISTQHTRDISLNRLQEAVMEEIISPVIPDRWMTRHTRVLINPAGPFITGGPAADCGLTGRKLMVDTYGGAARHGGGAFSGKDPSKVDRSAAYAARYIAKNVVSAGLASRCEIELAWAMGQPRPVAFAINTFGTAQAAPECIEQLIRHHFDLSVPGIIRSLDLLAPRYRKTACYGHFGRSGFPWESTDKAAQLRDDAHIPGQYQVGESPDPSVRRIV